MAAVCLLKAELMAMRVYGMEFIQQFDNTTVNPSFKADKAVSVW